MATAEQIIKFVEGIKFSELAALKQGVVPGTDVKFTAEGKGDISFDFGDKPGWQDTRHVRVMGAGEKYLRINATSTGNDVRHGDAGIGILLDADRDADGKYRVLREEKLSANGMDALELFDNAGKVKDFTVLRVDSKGNELYRTGLQNYSTPDWAQAIDDGLGLKSPADRAAADLSKASGTHVTRDNLGNLPADARQKLGLVDPSKPISLKR